MIAIIEDAELQEQVSRYGIPEAAIKLLVAEKEGGNWTGDREKIKISAARKLCMLTKALRAYGATVTWNQ